MVADYRWLTLTVISNTQVPEEYQLFSIQQAGTGHVDPLTVSITINGKSIPMEIDTGSAVSIISESVYKNFFEAQTSETLQQTEAKLCTYSGEQLPVKGKLICEVSYELLYLTFNCVNWRRSNPTGT